MSNKLYKLYCEVCNWQKITDGTDADSMYKIKTAPVPGGVPVYDAEKKKIIQKKAQEQPKKFRCPNCGRVVIPKKIKNPQEKLDQYQQDLIFQKKKEEWDLMDEEARRRYKQSQIDYDEEQSELDGDQAGSIGFTI
jgi:hypothetical protein